MAYKSYFNEAKSEIEKAKAKKAMEAAVHVRNKVVEKLSGNGTGRTYKVPGTGRTYTASSPGQPPAVLFGDLRQSIQFDAKDETAIVGSGLEKSKWLEFGTGRIAPRPFLKPTFVEEVDAIGQILGKTWFK